LRDSVSLINFFGKLKQTLPQVTCFYFPFLYCSRHKLKLLVQQLRLVLLV